MPPVAPMLAKSVAEDPGRRHELRAQVGRLPLDHLPRRRRGRDRQPQRAADDPVLPGDRRGGAGESARALRDRRRDRHSPMPTAGGWTSRRCCSGSTRPTAGSGCWPSRRPAAFVAFDLLALGDDDYTAEPFARAAGARSSRRWPARGRRSTSRRRPPTRRSREEWFSQFEGAGPGRRDRQAAGRALPAGQARDVQDQARADGRLRGGRVPGAQERPGRDRLAAARAVRRRRASWPASA